MTPESIAKMRRWVELIADVPESKQYLRRHFAKDACEVMDELLDAYEQRDQLLAAIKRLREDGINDDTVMLAEAAIEKVEGKR